MEKQIRKSGEIMKTSIIIPAYNEEDIIKKTVRDVDRVMRGKKYDYEILVVNDNSDDNTLRILRELAKSNKRLKIADKKSNIAGPSGLGSAIRFGFKKSSGDLLIPFMGDLSDDPRDIPKFIEKINEGYDVICGSRFIGNVSIENYPTIKLICNRIYNKAFATFFGLHISDISNAFKAYRRAVINSIKPESRGFEITSEIVLKAHIKRFEIGEVPVSWKGRKDKGVSKFGSFKSPKFILVKLPKIGVSYGMISLKLWMRFISNRIFGS
jgi:glycosyltransferase involved in cell wall biosynthesis